MIRLVAIVCLIAAPALAAGPEGEAKLAGLVRGRVAGAPVSCIPQRRDNRSHTIEGIGVAYDVGATRYVSRFDGGCEQLSAFTAFATRTPTTQLCAGDIAQIFTTTTPTTNVGSCTFGQFTPYTRLPGQRR